MTNTVEELEKALHIVSHDLKAPILQVTEFAKLFVRRRESDLTPDEEEYIRIIENSVQNLQSKFKGIYLYIDLLKHDDKPRKMSFEQFINSALNFWKVNNEHEIPEIHIDGSFPELDCYPTQVEILFYQLIDNAIKFAQYQKQTKVQIRTTLNKDSFDIAIKDSGIGIDEQFHEAVFDLFRRLHVGEEYPGIGLGLTLCKKIMDNHKGEIKINSKKGRGTTVHLSFPLSLS